MKEYYETYQNYGETYQLVVAHDTLDEAIEYADANNVDFIAEIGGCWSEFEKCWGCGEWIPCEEINKDGLCENCEARGREHGF